MRVRRGRRVHRGEGRRELEHVLLKGYSRLIQRAEPLLFIIISLLAYKIDMGFPPMLKKQDLAWLGAVHQGGDERNKTAVLRNHSSLAKSIKSRPVIVLRAVFVWMHQWEEQSLTTASGQRQHHQYLLSVSWTASVCLPQTTLLLSDGDRRRAEGEEALRRNKRLA